MKLFELTTNERSMINMLVLNERERIMKLLEKVSPAEDYLFFKALTEEVRTCNELLEAIKTPVDLKQETV